MNTYKTESGAKAAIKRQGLHLMNYEIRRIGNDRLPVFSPLFFCALPEDVAELLDRGFYAELNPAKAAV